MSLPIEDYALTAICQGLPVGGPQRSIDGCLAALRFRGLITPGGSGGSMAMADRARDHEARVTRRYRPSTLILETRFRMQRRHRDARRLHAHGRNNRRGSARGGERAGLGHVRTIGIPLRLWRDVPWVTRSTTAKLRALQGPDRVALRTRRVDLTGQNTKGHQRVRGRSGRTGAVRAPPTRPRICRRRSGRRAIGVEATEDFLEELVANCRPAGTASDAVPALADHAQACTYLPTGGMSPPRRHRAGAMGG